MTITGLAIGLQRIGSGAANKESSLLYLSNEK
jgi:hypothetical protein